MKNHRKYERCLQTVLTGCTVTPAKGSRSDPGGAPRPRQRPARGPLAYRARRLARDPAVRQAIDALAARIQDAAGGFACGGVGPRVGGQGRPPEAPSAASHRASASPSGAPSGAAIRTSNLPPLKSLRFDLPNASVGKPFDAAPEPADAPVGELRILCVAGLEAVGGLAWDPSSGRIAGTPVNDGDFALRLSARLALGDGGEREVEGSLRLTVIPDPDSLWRDLPPDPGLRFPKPVTDRGQVETRDGHRLLYASKRGRSHAHAATHRDDDGGIARAGDSGWSVLAVADGAGSCPFARRGSRVVAQKAMHALATVLDGEAGQALETATAVLSNQFVGEAFAPEIRSGLSRTLVTAAYTATDALLREAKEAGENPKDFSTTLLLAAHKQTSRGALIISFWIGDGALALYHRGRYVQLLGRPDSGDYAGQTRFLDANLFRDLDALWKDRISITLVEDFTALVLATDGVSDPRFESDHALADLACWDRLWAEIGPLACDPDPARASERLLEWMDFRAPGNHDDRTLALLIDAGALVAAAGDAVCATPEGTEPGPATDGSPGASPNATGDPWSQEADHG